jgi:hypothetical protein
MTYYLCSPRRQVVGRCCTDIYGKTSGTDLHRLVLSTRHRQGLAHCGSQKVYSLRQVAFVSPWHHFVPFQARNFQSVRRVRWNSRCFGYPGGRTMGQCCDEHCPLGTYTPAEDFTRCLHRKFSPTSALFPGGICQPLLGPILCPNDCCLVWKFCFFGDIF